MARPQPLVNLWLDDLRPPEYHPPFDALAATTMWVKTAKAAIEILEAQPVRWASLDHDLGITKELDCNHHTGYTVCLWMAEHNVWPVEGVIVHSWNPVGAEQMAQTVDRYGPYRFSTLRRPAIGVGVYESFSEH